MTLMPTASNNRRQLARMYAAIRRQMNELTQSKEIAETAQARLQEELNELSLHKAALDHSIIVSKTDSRGRITYANDPFSLISQYSREELVGQDHRIINSGHHPKSFFTDMWKTIASGKVWRGEMKNRAKDGSHYWVDTTIVPHIGADGRTEGYLALRVLITDRKEAEEKLEAKAEELERSNAELAQFAYVASHDLQEPLRMVTSYVQLLAKRCEGQLDSDAEEFIGYAVDGANRMKQLINDLLQYSRVGTKADDLTLIESETALEVTLHNLQASIEETGAKITHDTLPAVGADGQQISQLFQNLINNAIKYKGEEPPRIHISAERHGEFCVFSVRDNGIGIDQDYHERIFQVFQRLHTRSEYPGTGIGLAICKKIADRHGGRIWVESEVGKGSTFRFTIPIKEELTYVHTTAA